MNELATAGEGPKPSSRMNVGRKPLLFLLIGVCCVGFFIADVATPGCFEEPFSAMLVLGVVTAQLTVICVWGTLVRGTFWIRLPWTLLLLMISWCGFSWGITLAYGGYDTDAKFDLGIIWMFGFVTSFVPLKIAAICFRWRIVKDSVDGQGAGRYAGYAIRDIIIGTLLLALSMGIGRAMVADEEISLTRALERIGLFEPEMLIALSIYGFISLLVKLPCIWISLGVKAEKILSRIGLWIVYCLVLAIVEIGLLVAFLGNPGGQPESLFAGIIVGHQLMGAVMLSVFLALRGLGYRLERSIRKHVEHEAENEADAADR